MKRYFGILALIVGLGGSFAGSSAYAAPTLKVGLMDSYSGPAALYTTDVRDAFTMAVDAMNAGGGILGRKIEVVTRDDKFKVDVGLGVARELIQKENVDVLVGTIHSAIALAVSDLCKKEKVPFVVTFAKSATISGAAGHRYVFQVTENTAMAGRAGGDYLAKKPWTRFWVAGDDYDYGHTIGNETVEALKKLRPDAKILGETWWKLGTVDFTPYITAIMSAKPDAVILATGGGSNPAFLKAAKATGLAAQIPLFLHTSIEVATLKPIGQDAPEGIHGTANYLFYYPDSPANKAFVQNFQNRFKREPTVGAFYGYLAAHFLEQAYKKAGNVDKEKFIDALEGMTVSSPVGNVTMRAYDHQAVLPMFVGTTKASKKYPFLIAEGLTSVPGERTMPPIEEIKKEREAK